MDSSCSPVKKDLKLGSPFEALKFLSLEDLTKGKGEAEEESTRRSFLFCTFRLVSCKASILSGSCIATVDDCVLGNFMVLKSVNRNDSLFCAYVFQNHEIHYNKDFLLLVSCD